MNQPAIEEVEGREDADRLQAMLVIAIAEGSSLKLTDHYKDAPSLQDLAKRERAPQRWIASTCRHYFGLTRKQVPALHLKILALADDGDNSVTITMDFGKLFPGERPPELREAVAKLQQRFNLCPIQDEQDDSSTSDDSGAVGRP